MCARIAGILAPLISLLDVYHPSIPMVIFGSLPFLGGALTFLLPETRNTELQDHTEVPVDESLCVYVFIFSYMTDALLIKISRRIKFALNFLSSIFIHRGSKAAIIENGLNEEQEMSLKSTKLWDLFFFYKMVYVWKAGEDKQQCDCLLLTFQETCLYFIDWNTFLLYFCILSLIWNVNTHFVFIIKHCRIQLFHHTLCSHGHCCYSHTEFPGKSLLLLLNE